MKPYIFSNLCWGSITLITKQSCLLKVREMICWVVTYESFTVQVKLNLPGCSFQPYIVTLEVEVNVISSPDFEYFFFVCVRESVTNIC